MGENLKPTQVFLPETVMKKYNIFAARAGLSRKEVLNIVLTKLSENENLVNEFLNLKKEREVKN